MGYSAGDPGAYATDTDDDGYTAATDGPVIQPVDGVSGDEYDDTWGAARSGGRTHEGVDIMADEGTPVRAIASGEVVKGFTASSAASSSGSRAMTGTTTTTRICRRARSTICRSDNGWRRAR